MAVFLKVGDLMERYQVSRGTIHNLVKEGKFPQGLKFGKTRRWKPEDIEAFEADSAAMA